MFSRRSSRRAFTLVEILVVLAIIGILVALLLPAVQMAREAARKVQCQNNLKQLAMAIQQYHSTARVFPMAATPSPPRRGWVPSLLPYLDQPALEKAYQWNLDWDDPANQQVVNQRIRVLLCPSCPDGDRADRIDSQRTTAVCDYAPPARVARIVIDSGYAAPPKDPRGMISTGKPIRDVNVEDGLSNTLALVEAAGRPHFYTRFGLGPSESAPGGGNPPVIGGRVVGAGWADDQNQVPLHGFTYDGLAAGGPCAVNCTNNSEAFAFHPGGMNVVFGDGSTRLLAESIAISVYASLVTSCGKEILDQADY